jgi:hypothetical protein
MVEHEDLCDELSDLGIWWFHRSACWHVGLHVDIHCSRTWGIARYFYSFLTNSGRAIQLERVEDLAIGDVLQMDFGPARYVKHSMIVTKRTPDNLFLSSHDNDFVDEPFFGHGGIRARNGGAHYYPFHIK